MMDKNMLELWGRTLINAAHSQEQLEEITKYFGLNSGTDNPLMKPFFKTFNWQRPEKLDATEIVNLTQKSTDAYKEFFKAYFSIFDFVSKEEYLAVAKENEVLKEKISQQEKIINNYQKLSVPDAFDQEQVVDNMRQIMEKQTHQFQALMKQVDQYYKKGTTIKKK
jgi:hypothetical protein